MCEPSSIGRESECGNQTGDIAPTAQTHTNQPQTASTPALATLSWASALAPLACWQQNKQPPQTPTNHRPTQRDKPEPTNNTTQHKTTANPPQTQQMATERSEGGRKTPANRPNRHISESTSQPRTARVLRHTPPHDLWITGCGQLAYPQGYPQTCGQPVDNVVVGGDSPRRQH